MTDEVYTPGHAKFAEDFMARRGVESHAAFFLPYLKSGQSVLDCGCGPGTITLGIARQVNPGVVIGVDAATSQIEAATRNAANGKIENAGFQAAGIYELPFPDASFDRVFSHALFEHLADPPAAVKEMHRVLKPGGYAGLCSPDWDGFRVAPESEKLKRAFQAYRELQVANGGDVCAGQKLGGYLSKCGFSEVQIERRHENYPDLRLIGDYLARQLRENGLEEHAEVIDGWSRDAGADGLFAQSWVSAVGRK